MGFTDNFLHLYIMVYEPDNDAMGTSDTVGKNVNIRLDPKQIESYYPEWRDDREVINVTTKSGDNFYADIGLREFEKLLNKLNDD